MTFIAREAAMRSSLTLAASLFLFHWTPCSPLQLSSSTSSGLTLLRNEFVVGRRSSHTLSSTTDGHCDETLECCMARQIRYSLDAPHGIACRPAHLVKQTCDTFVARLRGGNDDDDDDFWKNSEPEEEDKFSRDEPAPDAVHIASYFRAFHQPGGWKLCGFIMTIFSLLFGSWLPMYFFTIWGIAEVLQFVAVKIVPRVTSLEVNDEICHNMLEPIREAVDSSDDDDSSSLFGDSD